MKKIAFIILIAASALLAGFHGSEAASGVCEGHGGVNCLAGPAFSGYAQCYDNSTSSVLYSSAGECSSDAATGCTSPVATGCTSSFQLQGLKSKLDKYTKECDLLNDMPVQYYTGCSFPSLQRQIQICEQQIQDYQISQQTYGSCIRNYYQTILQNTSTTLNDQLKIQKQACLLKQDYIWDDANSACVNTAPVAASSSSAAASSSIPSKYYLKTNLGTGTSGSDVIILQEFLQSKNFLKIPAGVSAGYFGPLTKKALINFQKSAGLPATGYCGILTRAAINNSR
ncbi:MAG TPA: peptidoglycan-binding domain-containing protein [Candidatus Paceibacterota bacterium]|nr:peptidoglycan-binding domain-containing protein [Candidatus Paceibacterota bacterium]